MTAKKSNISLARKIDAFLVDGNIGFENHVRTIPHWCAFLLPRLVKDWDVTKTT